MRHLRTVCLALLLFPIYSCPVLRPEPSPTPEPRSFEGGACREYTVEGGVGQGRVAPCSKLGKGR